jgi:uncharacterized phage infection (PIP) family protein YhgE
LIAGVAKWLRQSVAIEIKALAMISQIPMIESSSPSPRFLFYLLFNFRDIGDNMISKIKGLMESEEKIKEVHDKLTSHNENLNKQSEIIQTMHSDISGLKTNLTEFHNNSSEHFNLVKKELDEVKDIKSQINNELDDLKLLKTQLKQKVVDDLTTEFKKELLTNVERIKTDVKSYNDMKNSLQTINSSIEQVKLEMNKFNKIASNIRETDFTLEKHAKKLHDFSDEKHSLLKKIDALERMIGKERRRK